MKLGEIYRKVPQRAFGILSLVESLLPKYEYVPQELISSRIRLNPSELERLLELLVSLSLLQRRIGKGVGYRLTYLGLNILSLRGLVNRGIIGAIGDKIGVGKESEIYEALSPAQTRLSIKFHMVGRDSFKQFVRVRGFAAGTGFSNWLLKSKLNAMREYRAITRLSQYTDGVLRPFGFNKNAVVTEFVEGIELYKAPSLSDPRRAFEEIIRIIELSYSCAGIVHGDLSEYNVLVRMPDEKPIIIDWPQYIEKNHHSASELLRRDVCYISRYFKKKFGLTEDCSMLYERILNASSENICREISH
ncbi:MAG: RIO1 family regulatory kinase/ATPase [Fervidicoccaceae archaeon]